MKSSIKRIVTLSAAMFFVTTVAAFADDARQLVKDGYIMTVSINNISPEYNNLAISNNYLDVTVQTPQGRTQIMANVKYEFIQNDQVVLRGNLPFLSNSTASPYSGIEPDSRYESHFGGSIRLPERGVYQLEITLDFGNRTVLFETPIYVN